MRPKWFHLYRMGSLTANTLHFSLLNMSKNYLYFQKLSACCTFISSYCQDWETMTERTWGGGHTVLFHIDLQLYKCRASP